MQTNTKLANRFGILWKIVKVKSLVKRYTYLLVLHILLPFALALPNAKGT